MKISSEARKDRSILWTSLLKLLRGSSRVLLFREFHRFGPNLEIEFRITFVLDGLTEEIFKV